MRSPISGIVRNGAHALGAQGAKSAPLVNSAAASRLQQWTRKSGGQGLVTTMIWMMLLAMMVPTGFDYNGTGESFGGFLWQLTWVFLLASGFGLVMMRQQRALTVLKHVNPCLLLFLVLVTASYTWSIAPSVTLKRIVRAADVIAVCVAFTIVTWDPRRFQKVLRSCLTFTMVASIIFTIISPDNALHHSEQAELKDAWHGIMVGKNLFGSVASMCIILWLHGWIAKEVSGFKAALGGGCAVFCLAMTRSAGSMLATAFAVWFLLLLLWSPKASRRLMPYVVSLFALAVLVYALAVLDIVQGLDVILQPIQMLTGKEMTFTGRTAIWDILKQSIAQHPWLGCGYGAYWTGGIPGTPSYEMLTKLYFYPHEGHNGYLDVLNDLGWVGMIVLLGYFYFYISQSLKLFKVDRFQAALYLTFLFRGFLADMSETHWFVCMTVDFAILTLATTNLARHNLHCELHQSAGRPIPVRGWR